MTLEIILLSAIILSALAVSSLFSAAEVAIFSIHLPALRNLQQINADKAALLQKILSSPRRFLAAILLGNTLANATAVCGIILIWRTIMPDTSGWQHWIPAFLAVILLLLVGEILPKAVARQKTARFAFFTVRWICGIEALFHPLTARGQRLSEKIASRFTPSALRIHQGITEEEYTTMLDVGAREGALRSAERQFIERAISLADRCLRELMVPRIAMRCVDAELDLETMKAQAAALRRRRLPIFSESLDSIVGILNTRRLLLQPEMDVIECIEPAAFVPETMPAIDLLHNFLRSHQRMAIVLDEFGGVEGLITLEDLAEEVFGKITDEYDLDWPDWEPVEPGVFITRGRTPLWRIREWLRVDLEAEGVDTLGGWLAEKLGALPRVGDTVASGPCTFHVERVNRHCVDTILVRDRRKKR
ncbi:MAG: hemolysin family protein [Verrucomicrobiae bacterium]|nr:hemolysin family protein [Verrucomicrobiae bacterium]